MRRRKTYQHLTSAVFILFFSCQAGSLQASNQPDKASQEVAVVATAARTETEASAANNPSPAAVASALNEMRELIDSQRKQIEKLQSALEKQQQDLNRAMVAIEAKTPPVMVSATTSSAPAQPEPAISATRTR